MSELDLTEAIEAGGRELLLAWYDARDRPDDINGFDDADRAAVADRPDGWCLECSGVGPAALSAATLAVRAAAPIIERAVRDAIVARVEAEFITGAVAPEWAQAGGKPTAAGIRRWVIGIVRGEVGDG